MTSISVANLLPASLRAMVPPPRTRGTTIAGSVLALVAGVAAGVAGTAAHQVAGSWGGVRWPVGVVLALGLLLAVSMSVRAASSGSVPTLLVAVGWLAVTGAGSIGGPGGDVLVPDNWRGTAWVLGGAIVIVAVLVRGPGART